MPAWARGQSLTHARNGFGEVSGEDIELAVGNHHFTTGGRSGHAFAVSRVAPRHSTSLQTSRATVGRVWTALRWQGFFGVVLSAGRGGHVFGL